METAGKVMKCKAAVAWEAGKPLSIEEVEVTPPKVHKVRIKVFATGVRHTDAYTLSGSDPVGLFPVILGHEGAGTHGRGSHQVQARITMGRGLMPDNTSRFTCKGKQLFHFMGTSNFSEYTVVADIPRWMRRPPWTRCACWAAASPRATELPSTLPRYLPTG